MKQFQEDYAELGGNELSAKSQERQYLPAGSASDRAQFGALPKYFIFQKGGVAGRGGTQSLEVLRVALRCEGFAGGGEGKDRKGG